jgi:uncharacterized protein (TIGR02284 family)
MLPIHSILVPTDFSALSEYAFRLACSLARDHRARLTVLHVAPPPMAAYVGGVMTPEPPRNDRLWAQLREQYPADPRGAVEHLLAEGDPARMIVQAAAQSKCDLIVLGTHGRVGLGRVLLGSVAEEVVRRAPCPVVTVKTSVGDAGPATHAAATHVPGAVLERLIAVCKDGENGYRSALEDVDRQDLKELFGALSDQRARFAAELQAAAHPQGAAAEPRGTLAAKVHRGWMNLKAALKKGDAGTVLQEVDRGESSAMKSYEEALQQMTPPEVHALLERQYAQLKVDYGRIRALERTLQAR